MASGPLQIHPQELKFRFEVRKQVPSSLQLYNPTDAPVAFKVKTTSPKKYCVRPNTGTVAPGQTQEVTVIMQAQKEPPPDLQACKDKFLVQSALIAPGTAQEELSAEKMAELFSSKGAGTFETKLKVSYLLPHAPPSPVPEDSAGEMAAAAPAAPMPTSAAAPHEDPKLRNVLASLTAATEDREKEIIKMERLQRELATLATKRQTLELAAQKVSLAAAASATPPAATAMVTAMPNKGGYNLIHLLIISIIFFLLGCHV